MGYFSKNSPSYSLYSLFFLIYIYGLFANGYYDYL